MATSVAPEKGWRPVKSGIVEVRYRQNREADGKDERAPAHPALRIERGLPGQTNLRESRQRGDSRELEANCQRDPRETIPSWSSRPLSPISGRSGRMQTKASREPSGSSQLVAPLPAVRPDQSNSNLARDLILNFGGVIGSSAGGGPRFRTTAGR